MKDEKGTSVLGRTRWRKFAVAAVPAAIAAGAMVVAMGNGALAASFAVSGQSFEVSADHLHGDGFVQYGSIDKDASGGYHPIAIAGIRSATLTNLCQSVVVKTPLGPVTMLINAGSPSSPVTADSLFIDVQQLQGDATFKNIEIGRDASTLDKGPTGAQGGVGGFGQQADTVDIDGVKQTAWATNAGTFKLTNLNLQVLLGSQPCF